MAGLCLDDLILCIYLLNLEWFLLHVSMLSVLQVRYCRIIPACLLRALGVWTSHVLMHLPQSQG